MAETNPPPLPTESGSGSIAGFWRRVAAFLVDSFLVGLVGFGLGLLFFSKFAELGLWGRLIGFFICLTYFGLMNSALASGQTLGKRLFRIRVVDVADRPISVARSCGRYVVLALPFFLNNLQLPPNLLLTWVGYTVGFLLFGFGLPILYLIVFNRRNRRSLHDLLAGTYVIRSAAAQSAGPKPKTWFGHYVIVTLIFAAVLSFPVFTTGLINKPPFKDILSLQSKLIEQPNVRFAGVTMGTIHFLNKEAEKNTDNLSATIYVSKPVPDYDAFGNAMAKAILENYPPALRKDTININIVYGYDIGIASGHVQRSYSYPPVEWQQRIGSR